jgi:hypothetical protein
MSGRPSRRTWRPPPPQILTGLLLPLSVVFILLQPVSPLAAVADCEVGGTARGNGPPKPPLDLSLLGFELSAHAGYAVFSEQDMYDTYGGMRQVGLEASVGVDADARFVIGVGYGSTTGDPFYDLPEFEGGSDVRLRTAPVTVGFKLNASRNPRYRVYWGMFVVCTWLEEKVPAVDAISADPYRTYDGWGMGYLTTIAPEWRSRDQRRAVGLTLHWGGSSGDVGRGHDKHHVNLVGPGARLHYTITM